MRYPAFGLDLLFLLLIPLLLLLLLLILILLVLPILPQTLSFAPMLALNCARPARHFLRNSRDYRLFRTLFPATDSLRLWSSAGGTLLSGREQPC